MGKMLLLTPLHQYQKALKAYFEPFLCSLLMCLCVLFFTFILFLLFNGSLVICLCVYYVYAHYAAFLAK